MAKTLSGVPPAFLLFAASSLWGAATVLNKHLLVTISPTLLLVVQLLASATALSLAVIGLKRTLPRGQVLLASIALGALNPGVSYTFSLMGLDRISASVSSLLWATEPFLILGLAWLILKEPITPKIFATIAVGFAGVFCVSGLFAGRSGGETDLVGVALLVAAVLICAVYTVLSRGLGSSVDPLSLVAVQQVAGLAWATGLYAVMAGTSIGTEILAVPATELATAALSGLLYFAVAYWLYLSALGRVSAALAGGSFNIIPLVTIVLAYAVLGERLTGLQLFGAGLIFVSAMALFWLTRSHPDQRRDMA